MLVRHHHAGRVYQIEFPEGCLVQRCKGVGFTIVWVPDPDGGRDHFVPDWPGELIVGLARAGKYGLRLVSERPAQAPAGHP